MATNQSRVEIPAYTDCWMMGDRYGTIIRIIKQRRNFPAGAPVHADAAGTYVNIARVLLDKSHKTMNFIFDDCRDI